jgi:uncharacterized membrane protein
MDWLSPLKGLFEFALPVLDKVPVIRALLGFVIVFFLPGFAWTLVFFRQLRVIERVALSFGLSIALVTLSIFALNVVFGVRINGLNSLLIIVIITVIPLAIYYFRYFRKRKRGMAGNPPEE